MSSSEPPTVFAAVGGAPFFDAVVERFYAGVSDDPLLRPMYPDDLAESKRWLALFLMQYWGGPTTYSEERGHPRLRMRHAPFHIGGAERDAWLGHMTAAILATATELEVPPELERQILDYVASAATFMVNAPD